MKKNTIIFTMCTMLVIYLAACDSNDKVKTKDREIEDTTLDTTFDIGTDFLDNPTEEYIISCLEQTPNVVEIAAVTEDNDPNNHLNEDGYYYSAVFFSVDLINQEKVYGDNLIDKGTDAGGCIEVYKTVEDAKTRNEYLSKVNKSIILDSGSHTVEGTLVIRLSKELPEDLQLMLEHNIISVLQGEDSENLKVIAVPETEAETKKIKKIEMPNDSSFYESSDWTLETLIKHFEDLGFNNIEKTSSAVSGKYDIVSVEVSSGLFGENEWKSGDEFESNDKITICYNESPILTVANCPDLVAILNDSTIDYMEFSNNYDGREVEFNAYVWRNHKDSITLDRSMSVMAREDGNGTLIHIGMRSWGASINENASVGSEVVVKGEISASWSDYYNSFYVETSYLH